MTGLKLVPNEIEGYRVKPDYYNWTVVSLKRHGATSKHANEIYETPVGYYSTLPNAFHAIYKLECKLHAEAGQRAIEAETGELCSHDPLLAAFKAGELAVLQAAEAFDKELKEAGITLWDLAKRLRPADASTDNEEHDQ